MPIQVLMPALSPTMEKGNLSKWLKKEGETIKSGDVIAEIETDKATMEVEAVDEGTLGKILVPEGTADVAGKTPIAVILSDGEKASDIKAGSAPAPQQKAGESAPPAQAGKGEAQMPGQRENPPNTRAGGAPARKKRGANPPPPARGKKAEAKGPAEPKPAVAPPPQPEAQPEPDVPDGTEMVTMTMREALRDAMAEEMRRDG